MKREYLLLLAGLMMVCLTVSCPSAQIATPSQNVSDGVTLGEPSDWNPNTGFYPFDDPTDPVDTVWWTGNIDQHVFPGQVISWDYDLPQMEGLVLLMKYGLWNSPEVYLIVRVNGVRVGYWIADQGYISPGPEYGRAPISNTVIPGMDHIEVRAYSGGEAVVGFVAVGYRSHGDVDAFGVSGNTECIKSKLNVSPNPFNPTTQISYELQSAGHVSLIVYNTAGQRVAELVDGWKDLGVYNVQFDGSHLPSGIYVYRMELGGSATIGKLVLMK